MAEADPRPLRPPPSRALAVRIAVSLAIAVGLAWTMIRGGLPVVPDGRAFDGLAPWTIPAYAAVLLGMHVLRAARWRHLLRAVADVPLATVLGTAWMGFAAVMFLPLRAGEVVRPLLVSKRSAVTGWQAAGTVGAERIIDGLCLSLILLAGLALDHARTFSGDGSVLDRAATVVADAGAAMCGLFAACFAMLWLFHWRPAAAARLVRAITGWMSRPVAERAVAIAERLAEGLSFLGSPKHAWPFLLETACYWALNATGLWLLAMGCRLEGVGLAEACVVMGCLGFGILVPSGPGFFGAFQLSIYLGLALYLPREVVSARGSAFVFIAYLCQIAQHVIGAAVGALLMPAEKLSRERPPA